MMMKPFRIAGISFWPELWKAKANLKQILGFPTQAVGRGVFGNRQMARTFLIGESEDAYAKRHRENVKRRMQAK